MCINCNGCKTNKKSCSIAKLTNALVLIGAFNWGLVGLGMLSNMTSGTSLNFNLVHAVFGVDPVFEAVVYIIVGLSALAAIWGCRCKTCKKGLCCKDCK